MDNNPFDIYTEEYENWFKENEITFQSELLALKRVVPIGKRGIEIGIGSGIFAEKLNIEFGIDPSGKMLEYARQRNLIVKKGIAEDLPYSNKSFDFAAFITSLCFIRNPAKALEEAHRVIKENGDIIVAFIDKESSLGQILMVEKKESIFYRIAKFYSVPEMVVLIESANFKVKNIYQTLIDINKKEIENPIEGFGKGSFVVIKGRKK